MDRRKILNVIINNVLCILMVIVLSVERSGGVYFTPKYIHFIRSNIWTVRFHLIEIRIPTTGLSRGILVKLSTCVLKFFLPYDLFFTEDNLFVICSILKSKIFSDIIYRFKGTKSNLKITRSWCNKYNKLFNGIKI
jgi:hypothetical protein